MSNASRYRKGLAVPKPDQAAYDLAHAMMLDRLITTWEYVRRGTTDRPVGWYVTSKGGHEDGPLVRTVFIQVLRAYGTPSSEALAQACTDAPLCPSADVDRLIAVAELPFGARAA